MCIRAYIVSGIVLGKFNGLCISKSAYETSRNQFCQPRGLECLILIMTYKQSSICPFH